MQDQNCPVCNTPIDPDSTACGTCGFKIVGRTEEFHSVNNLSGEQPAVAPAGGVPSFTMLKGPLKGEKFQLAGFPTVIGRDPSCDMFLNDRTVTRKHATIDAIDGEVVITDMNSMNGTWVDGERCDKATLKSGSIVQIGTFLMQFNI